MIYMALLLCTSLQNMNHKKAQDVKRTHIIKISVNKIKLHDQPGYSLPRRAFIKEVFPVEY